MSKGARGLDAARKQKSPLAAKSRAAAKTNDSVPIYHQLYTTLRQQIMDGVYKEHEALPTEMSLTETYKVSRVTVRKSLLKLEQDGLLVRQQGVGTFVAPMGRQAPAERLSGVVDNLITIGVETSAKLLSFNASFQPPPFMAATQKLELQPSEKCIRIERLRHHKRKPFSLTTIYVRNIDGLRLTRADLEADGRPLIHLLDERGVSASHAEQTISAIVADAQVAEKLNVAVGSPLIRARRTVYASDRTPVLYQESLYNPDLYEYHITLSRDSKQTRPEWRHT